MHERFPAYQQSRLHSRARYTGRITWIQTCSNYLCSNKTASGPDDGCTILQFQVVNFPCPKFYLRVLGGDLLEVVHSRADVGRAHEQRMERLQEGQQKQKHVAKQGREEIVMWTNWRDVNVSKCSFRGCDVNRNYSQQSYSSGLGNKNSCIVPSAERVSAPTFAQREDTP